MDKCPKCGDSNFYLSRTVTIVESVPYSPDDPDPFGHAELGDIVDTGDIIIACVSGPCDWYDNYNESEDD